MKWKQTIHRKNELLRSKLRGIEYKIKEKGTEASLLVLTQFL